MISWKKKLMVGLGGVLVLVIIVPPLTDHDTATVLVNGSTKTVVVADTWYERLRGMKGVALNDMEEDGVLVLYRNKDVREFSSAGMKFPVNVVWLKEKKVVRSDFAVQKNGDTGEDTVVQSAPIAVDAILLLPTETTTDIAAVPGNIVVITLD